MPVLINPSGAGAKAQLDMDRFREQSYHRIMSGFYIVQHEDGKHWIPYIPQKYLVPMLEDILGERDVYSNVCLKPRQAKLSTFFGILMLDWLLWRPGFEGNVTAQRNEKDRDLLSSHVGKRIEKMHMVGRLWLPDGTGRWRLDKHAAEPGVIQVKKEEIVANHLNGESSKIDAEDPRSMNPTMMWMSEAGVLEASNPDTFREIYEGIAPLKFSRKQWETTIKGVGEQFRKIYEGAKEETNYNHKHFPTGRWPKQSRFARFWGWYVIETNRRPLAFADEHRTNRDVNVYLETLNREIVNNNIWEPLDDEQWNFYRHEIESVYFGDYNAAWYQIPSRDYEAFKATVSTRYLLDKITAASEAGRIGTFPADETNKCVIFFDLGNEMGMVWGQPDKQAANMWRSPLSRRMRNATAEDCLDEIEARRIPVALLMLPHDGLNRNKAAHNLQDRVGDEAAKEYFEKRIRRRVEAGSRFWRGVAVDTMGKPGREEINITTALEMIDQVNFDFAGNRETLLDALKHVEQRDDKKIVKTGEAGRASHLHDAFVLMCRFMESEYNLEDRESTAAGMGAAFAEERNAGVTAVVTA